MSSPKRQARPTRRISIKDAFTKGLNYKQIILDNINKKIAPYDIKVNTYSPNPPHHQLHS